MVRVTKPTEERRQEITDTARSLFIENGFDKTPMADISKKMNVAQGLVYHYFKSKTELLYAVVDELVEDKLQAATKIVGDTKGSALERIKTLVFFQQQTGDYERLLGNLGSDPAMVEYCRQKKYSPFVPLLVSLIEQGNADKSLSCEYPKQSAIFILQSMPKIMAGPSSSPKENEEEVKVYMGIISRVLGAALPSA
jgi:AcrR family transcriptional regulator